MFQSKRKIDDKRLLELHAEGKTCTELAKEFNCSIPAVSKRLAKLAMRPTKIDSLTDKQAAFVKAVASGKSATAAAESCFDTTSRASAKEVGAKLMKLPQIQEALTECLDRHGLTRSYRVARLKEHVDCDDPAVSIKGLDMAFKLADEYPAAKTKNINVTAELDLIDLSSYRNTCG